MSLTNGFDAEIGPSRRIMRFLGVYPDSQRNGSWTSRCHFLIPAIVMFYFCNIPQSVTVMRVWGDLNEVLDVLTGSDIPFGIALFKLLGLRYNADVLSRLVLSMSDDWKSPKTKQELKEMWKNAKLGRLISIVTMFLSGGTVSAYFVGAIFLFVSEYKQLHAQEINATDTIRSLYVKSEFFYDVQKSPRFEITWGFQVFSAIFAASSFSSTDALFAVIVLHLCGQLNNLQQNIRCLSNIISSETYSVTLARIIKRHEYLDNFAKSTEDTFNAMFLVQMLASSVVLCLQGYQLVVMTSTEGGIPIFDMIFMIYFTLLFLFSLFTYCYVSEILRKESTEIGDVAYGIGWYNLPVTKAKPLIIIILRARRPFKITAGKFADFSLELYCNILKTSASYLSMLLAVRDRLAIAQ